MSAETSEVRPPDSGGGKSRTDFTKSYYNLGVDVDEEFDNQSQHENTDEMAEDTISRMEDDIAVKTRGGQQHWRETKAVMMGIPPDIVTSAHRLKVVKDVSDAGSGTSRLSPNGTQPTSKEIPQVHIIGQDGPVMRPIDPPARSALPPIIDYKKILSDSYRNLDDLLDGEAWEDDVFTTPPSKVNLVVRLSEGLGSRYTYFKDDEEGYSPSSRSQRLVVQRVAATGDAEDGSSVPWMDQCGLSCSSTCSIM